MSILRKISTNSYSKTYKSIVQSFRVLIIREFILKIFALVGQLFLARLLVPSDFGIYVIIVFIVNFFGLFSDIGLSLAIIQKKRKPTHIELSSIFTLKVFLALSLIFLIWVIAPFTKLFYPSFTSSNIFMLKFFSITLLLSSLRTVPISLLERKLNYNFISFLDIVGVLIYYVISVAGALLSFGVWSFLMGAVIKEIIETIILYSFFPFLPMIVVSIKNIRKMIKFGMYLQWNGLVNFITYSITPVIGGRITGPYGVGIIDFSYSIASLPETIGINFGRVAFASYSRIQEQEKLFMNAINKSMRFLSIMLYVFPVMIISFGSQLIPLLFSAKWSSAIPVLYWYSSVSFFLPIMISLGQGIIAIGKSKELFLGTFTIALLGWIITLILINMLGVIAIAITYFFTVLFFCGYYVYIFHKNGFSFNIISSLGLKFIIALLTIIFSLILNSVLPSILLILFLKITVCLLFYFFLLLIFEKKDTLDFLELIKNSFRTNK